MALMLPLLPSGSSSAALNSTSSAVRSMNASSSDACCGVSSWSAIRLAAAVVADLLGGQAVDLEQPRLERS